MIYIPNKNETKINATPTNQSDLNTLKVLKSILTQQMKENCLMFQV